MSADDPVDSLDSVVEDLAFALLAVRATGGPRRAAKQILQSGRSQVWDAVETLSEVDRVDAESIARRLAGDGVYAVVCDDVGYPELLRNFTGAPPALFCKGPVDLLGGMLVGICGSRKVSTRGLNAARACAEEVACLGGTVVSGYAKGVDTESFFAALKSGGSTIAVLPEGIDHYRLKKGIDWTEFPVGAAEKILTVSQFPPSQRWTVGAAMARNSVVVGLSRALVVVEAGEKGGTRNAGELALRGRRPVLILDSDEDSVGNHHLISKGARLIAERAQLSAALSNLQVLEDPQLPFE